MVGIAQLVRAPGCDSGGRGFKSRYPPHYFFIIHYFAKFVKHLRGCSIMVVSLPSKQAARVRFPSPAPLKTKFDLVVLFYNTNRLIFLFLRVPVAQLDRATAF